MNGINMLIQMFLLLAKGSHFPPEFDIYLFIYFAFEVLFYFTLLCDSLNFLVCLFFKKWQQLANWSTAEIFPSACI